ncbi:MAG TPA: PEP-CTERM sorting domain-containing protein [Bryobacteraceae bacterium]|jgi:hypothetical protein|nr:PEP-CTERM sorting domain-containing protein [Bryobacteraceae bacterium]
MKLVRTTLFLAGLIAVAEPWQAKAICVASTNISDFSVAPNGPVWTYNFQVTNGCVPGHQPLLTDFYVPYFSDAGITNITVPGPSDSTNPPTTWTFSIEANNDLFGLGPDAGVIDFHVTSLANVAANENLPGVGYYGANGFTFDSPFAPVEGPWAILETDYDNGLYDTTSLLTGDPSIPGSPDTIAALAQAAAPEPGSVMLLAIGLGLLTIATVRKRVDSVK